jgi:hypothetical protein
MPEIALENQSCSNCIAYRPSLEGAGGKCQAHPPQRVGPGAASFPATEGNYWCLEWQQHPRAGGETFASPTERMIVVASKWEQEQAPEEPPQDAPYDPPTEPAAVVEPPAPTAEPALTRPPSGKASHQKWKREPAASDPNANPEELK